MFSLLIPGGEFWNETTEEFIYGKAQTLSLEHSLVSLSKWESKWNKPFLTKQDHSRVETVDYIRCMTLTQNVELSVYDRITTAQISAVNKYMNLPMSAAVFNVREQKKNYNEFVTAETIYYWMITYGIPFDPCQKWHLNRLFALIRFCSVKNNPGKKMSKKEILANNAAVNAARRKKYQTTG